jgi:DNA polymerase III sliding clamp (beta) subunit (PCNA family)
MTISTDNSMELVAEDIDFSRKGQEFVDVENNTLKNGKLEIGFKGTFANVCMSAISSDKVRLELTDASRPIVMKDLDNEDKTLILMPMML